MPGPFTTPFLALIYDALYAISVGQQIAAWVLGGAAFVVVALYWAACTPAVVFLAQAELGESGQD